MNNTTSENEMQLRMPAKWATQVSSTIEIIFAVIILFGNFIFIGAIIFKKKLQTFGYAFMVNLSLTDIFSVLFVSTFSIDSQFRRGWHLGYTMCVIHIVFHPIAVGTSLYSTACIAINRYFFIVHHGIYNRITTKVSFALAVLFIWALPTVIHGYGVPHNSEYHPPVFRCRAYVTELEFAVTMYFPSALTVAFYLLIFIHVRQSRKRVQSYPDQSANTNKGPSQQEIRMLKALIAVFTLVLFGYLPYIFIVNIYTALGGLPPIESLILVYPLRNLAGVLNPFLYGFSNANFLVAYKELLTGKLFRGKAGNAVAPHHNTRQDRSMPPGGSTAPDNTHGRNEATTRAKTSAPMRTFLATVTVDGNNPADNPVVIGTATCTSV